MCQFCIIYDRFVVDIVYFYILFGPVLDRLPDQQSVIAIGIVRQFVRIGDLAFGEVDRGHFLGKVKRQPCLDRSELARANRAPEKGVDRTAFVDQCFHRQIVDEQGALEMRNQQRPERMDIGKIAAGGDGDGLADQMGAAEVDEQFVIIAVGDLDDEFRHLPAPFVRSRDRRRHHRIATAVLPALDSDRFQRRPARRDGEQGHRAVDIFCNPLPDTINKNLQRLVIAQIYPALR